MLFGIVIACVLNVGYRVVYYTLFDNFASYELSWFSIATGTICFGILVPLISNIGPTRLALGKNLRTSLDVTRRSSLIEEVSVTFNRLNDVSFSFNEVALGISLTLLGFVVYVFIPQALIQERMIEFFLILNMILVLIALGLTFVATVILPSLQRVVLKFLIFLNPKDRCLESLTKKRLESM